MEYGEEREGTTPLDPEGRGKREEEGKEKNERVSGSIIICNYRFIIGMEYAPGTG